MPKAAPAREIPPPLELLCLRALWSLGEASVKDVQQAVLHSKPLAYTTVMTLLERLVRKGILSRRKIGRAFAYIPQITRDSVQRMALREFVTTYFDGSEEELRDFLGAGPGFQEEIVAPAEPKRELEPERRLDPALL